MVNITSNTAGLVRGIAQAQGAVAGFGNKMTKAGRSLSTVGSKLTRTVSTPLIAVGGYALHSAVQFEGAMTKISALVGASDKQMGIYERKVMGLSKTLPIGPTALADALYFVTSSGFEGAGALDVLEVSAKASAAGMGEVALVADAVTSAVSAWGKATLAPQEATDLLLATVREGKAEPEELAASIGKVIPVAESLGVSFNDVSASLASMTLTGLDASESTTALRGIFNTFAKPVDASKEALKKIGMTVEEVNRGIDKDLFGTMMKMRTRFEKEGIMPAEVFRNVRALTGFLSITGRRADKNSEIFDKLANSVGDTDKAFQKASESSGFKFRQNLADLQRTAINLGKELIPIAIDAAEAVTDFVKSFNKMDPGAKEDLLKLGAALVLLGPGVRILGALASVAGGAAKGIAWLIGSLKGAKVAGAGAAALMAGFTAPTVGRDAATGRFTKLTGGLKTLGTQAAATGVAVKGSSAAVGSLGSGAGAAAVPIAAVVAGLVLMGLGIKGTIDDARRAREETGGFVKSVGVEASIASGKVQQIGDELYEVRTGFSVATGAGSKMIGNLVGNVDELRSAHNRLRGAQAAAGDSWLIYERGLSRTSDTWKDYISVAERGKNLTKSQQIQIARGMVQLDRWGSGINQVTRNQVEHYLAIGKTGKALRILQGSVRETKEGIKGATDATTGFTGALDQVPPRKTVDTNPAKRSLDEATSKTHGWEAALNGIPTRVTSTATLDTSQANAAFDGLFARLHGWEASAANATAAPPRGGPGGLASPRALGGPVMAGLPYKVGEQGEELFIPEVDGSILSHQETRKLNSRTARQTNLTASRGIEGKSSSGFGGRLSARLIKIEDDGGLLLELIDERSGEVIDSRGRQDAVRKRQGANR
jgi:TP901 family phage tail tape measure protein